MQCSKFPDRPATGICAYSGKPYCAEELVEVQGKMYAKDNLSQVFAEIKEKPNDQTPMVFMNAGGAAAASTNSSIHTANISDNRSLWMSITSLIFGILCLLAVFDDSPWDKDTILGIVMFSVMGLFFGSISIAKHNAGKGMAITGIIFSSIALLSLIGMYG